MYWRKTGNCGGSREILKQVRVCLLRQRKSLDTKPSFCCLLCSACWEFSASVWTVVFICLGWFCSVLYAFALFCTGWFTALACYTFTPVLVTWRGLSWKVISSKYSPRVFEGKKWMGLPGRGGWKEETQPFWSFPSVVSTLVARKEAYEGSSFQKQHRENYFS